MMRVFGLMRRVAEKIESTPVSVMEWVLVFLGIVTVRFFLEAFSSRNTTGYIASDASTNVHFAIFYLVMVLTLTLIISTIAQRPFARTAKVALVALPLIWLSPLFDLAITGGAQMAYIFDHPQQLFIDLVTYFGPTRSPGVTIGIKIEIAIMLTLVASYVYAVTASVRRSLGVFVLTYVAIFVSGAFPSLLMIFSASSVSVSYEWWSVVAHSLIGFTSFHPTVTFPVIRTFELLFNVAMMQCWFLVLLLLLVITLRKSTPHILSAIIKNIRPPRLAHYLGLVLVGGYVAYVIEPIHRTWLLLDGVTVLVALSSIALAWVSAVSSNDIVDETTDRISNINRPLIRGDMNKEEMKTVAIWSGVLALLGAYTLGSYSMYFVGLYVAVSFVYSMPPLRLKRIPIVATFLLSLASLASTMLGFFLVSQERKLDAFPPELAVLIIGAFTLGMNWKDLKDIEGDRASGVVTIPTLLGDRMGRFVIGGMLFAGFMLVPLCTEKSVFIIPSALAGLFLWVGVVKRRGERYVFSVFFTSIAVLVGLFEFFR